MFNHSSRPSQNILIVFNVKTTALIFFVQNPLPFFLWPIIPKGIINGRFYFEICYPLHPIFGSCVCCDLYFNKTWFAFIWRKYSGEGRMVLITSHKDSLAFCSSSQQLIRFIALKINFRRSSLISLIWPLSYKLVLWPGERYGVPFPKTPGLLGRSWNLNRILLRHLKEIWYYFCASWCIWIHFYWSSSIY